ncbi:alpha/beta fold hydrolase, partial [Ilumatobacter sp.]|uniref:alpha/beta fold hydrolase n=1 Tax=Ilumatobacter sp. TaxID=1967498 RepID=UPI003C55DB9D
MTSPRSATPDRPAEATWRSWGIDPAWSRQLDVPSHDGSTHRWHLLDTGPGESGAVTILCVHGNPTWAYAWKSFLDRFGSAHRVVAIDQLGMGYSERLDPSNGARRYADRVADLADLTERLGLIDEASASGIVLAAHDWGGAIALGWAVDHADDVAAMVLCNTGIAVPAGRRAPKIIRLAASGPLRDLVCRRTSAFVEGTVRLSGRRITRQDRIAFRAPYRHAEWRRSIADFVGDIPLGDVTRDDDHPSAGALVEVASKLDAIESPVLLAWGANDIVFDDDFAQDLLERLPNARLERFARANHLVMAETDVVSAVDAFLRDLDDGSSEKPDDPAPSSVTATTPSDSAITPRTGPTASTVFDGLRRREGDDAIAISDLAARESIDFATFARRVDAVAAGLVRRGLAPGD